MNRNQARIALTLAAAALVLSFPSASHAAIILSTDFSGRTVSGDTAGNITWTTNGVSSPGVLTAVDVNATGKLAGLYDTANAQGHFAPDLNTGNEGPWSTSLTLSLTVPEISLADVVLDYQHFNNSGGFQTVGRKVNWTATVTRSVSGQLDSVKVIGTSSTFGIETITFDTPLILTSGESYEVTILAEGGDGNGNNTGLDGLTLNGVVPEPASLALMGLGGLMMLRRRRA